MNLEDPLGRALRELPRERAGEDFTPRLLERLRRDSEPRPLAGGRRRAALLLVAATGALAVALALGLAFRPTGFEAPKSRAAEAPRAAQGVEAASAPGATPALGEIEERLARLRREHRQLEEELRALRTRLPESPSVIYLGGDEDLDLVLDLGSPERGAANRNRPPAARPPHGPASL